MRQLSIAIGCALALTMFAGSAVAETPETREGIRFDFGECPAGKVVIDVTQKILNDGDSGVASYWAYDNYTKHIRVWQTDSTTFCAIVEYEGTFKSIAGFSPAGTSSIAAGITGGLAGGYRATITGTLKPNPAYKRKGFLGVFNFGWTGTPGAPAPNPFDWVGVYFQPASTFDFFWWGWVYSDRDGDVWINSAGNAGDIK